MYDDCPALAPSAGRAAFFEGRLRVVSGARSDAGEDIALVEEPLVRRKRRGGRLQDAKTLVAGLWILSHRKRLDL